MAIRRFFNKDVIVSRLKTISGVKKNFVTTATVDGSIQEMDLDSRNILGILEEQAWVGYFDITDNILKGDRLVDNYSKRYIVREVTKVDFGINQHLEALLVEYNE